ncbi:hypothetical protein K438DRAFT_1825128 [Mycena galopus ATCC 62051]|nr:hypothetical protein K438DRAFT_1825128 [Mycena galopus ATCC 62051]
MSPSLGPVPQPSISLQPSPAHLYGTHLGQSLCCTPLPNVHDNCSRTPPFSPLPCASSRVVCSGPVSALPH